MFGVDRGQLGSATPFQLKGQLGLLMVSGLDSLCFYPMPV